MIIYGRITVFGEYLMHNMTDGYVVPARHGLATPDEHDLPIHASYDYRTDRVRRRLSEMGLPVCDNVRGTLPLGYGFAGSTVLTALHLGTGSLVNCEMIAYQIDQEMHGFAPSGVDYWSVKAQAAGFFGPAGWRSAPKPNGFAASALLVPETQGWALSETQGRIKRVAHRLAPIASHLCEVLRAQTYLDYGALFEYALELRRAGVYGPRAATIVDHLLNSQLAAKGIGGLTNKAVIIVWPVKMPMPARLSMLRTLMKYNPDGILTWL